MAINKKIPKKEEKDSSVQKLKNRIKKLEAINKRLLEENKTLEAYKNITNKYVGDELDGIPVEKLVRSIAKHHGRLDEVVEEHEPSCPQCTNKKLTILPRLDGEFHSCRECGFNKVVKK